MFMATVSVLVPAAGAARADEAEPIFYPRPPNLPRIQYLKTFSSALDVSKEKKGFRDFVFGGAENEAKLLQKPYGVAIHNGAVFAIDTRGYGYAVFDLANDKSRVVKPGGSATLKKPINITIDEDGTRYVTDTGREQVVVFDADDKFVRALGAKGQFKPADTAIVGDRIYISDLANHQIVILDKMTGQEIKRFGAGGSRPGQLAHPTSLALGPDGTLFVTDTNNFRLQEFSLDGELIRTIGSVGNTPGHFARPKGIDVDRDGYIYAVDSGFNNIQVFAPDGGVVMAFGSQSDQPDSIDLPSALRIDYDNISYFEKYVADNFDLKYLILVTSQFGLNKVTVFGYGEFQD